jgi:outer membrane protein OmpA-like peptidoglycan-associated protein/Tfp pilus assembly protein PilF
MRLISFYIICFILGLSCNVTGQKSNTSGFTNARNASKKTQENYRKAYALFRQKEFKKSEKEFLKLIKKDPTFVNSYLIMSELKKAEKDTSSAVDYLNKANEIAPDYDPRTYLALARIAMNRSNYAEAVKQADQFLNYTKVNQKLRKKAEKLRLDAIFRPKALQNPVPFEPKNLGDKINSANRDYFPSLTLNNDLVYTVQIGEGQQGQEDLYISHFKNDAWQKSNPIANVNTNDNEGAQSISADGRLLVFTVCNRPGDMGSCDLYYSRKMNGKWTKPKNIGSPINSPNWESQPSIAPNADAIYFVRGGPRGTGDKDLYITRLQDNGTWATPEKIEELNTPYHESSPSIHPDGKTLYFSSKGHEGMGGYDLFISRLQENGKWGKPQNLGYPINTAAAEEALAVSWQGDVAYLASNRAGGFGSLDIYSFELPPNAKPAPITYIKGITKDAETNQPLSAYVEIIDLKTQKRFTKLTTKRDGEFTICLPTGEYALNARRPQYAFFSANYDLNEAAALTEAYQLIAPLQPIKEKQDNQPIVLENVFFETASAVLRDNSKAELDKLKAFLEENATIKIQLNGHTDNVGEEEDNLLLSDQRANAVRNYLIKNGIDSSRMTAKGFGESKPIQSNETTTGRSKNRRTEFQIMP